MIKGTNSTDSNHEPSVHNEDHSSFNLPNISEDENQQQQQQQQGTSSDAKSVIFILEQIISLLKITLQTSSKLISPAITQMIQNILPVIQQYYQQAAPIRIQEWLQILTSALQSFFTIMSETMEGREVLDQFHNVAGTTAHLLTSANTRQIIIEGVGLQVKGIEALSTPEMKVFLSSIPVYVIRVLDTLSSGEAKYLYHSLAALVWNIIELLGQDETTLALAELTAHLIHVLEQERECYGSWNHHRKQRKVRKVRHIKIAPMMRRGRRKNANAAVVANAKKRHERNRFIAQTYTDRTMLKDRDSEDGDGSVMGDGEDRVVEDAILSSLGDNTRSDNAWLTSLGRNEEGMSMGMSMDETSLPSRVILPTSIPNQGGELLSEQQLRGESLDDAMVDDLDRHVGTEEKVVDLAYLRNGIETRKVTSHRDQNPNEAKEQKDRRVQIQNMNRIESSNLHTSTRSVAGDSVVEDSFVSLDDKGDDEKIAIEDLVLGGDDELGHSADTQKSPLKKAVSNDSNGNGVLSRRRRAQNLMHEDSDEDSFPARADQINETYKTNMRTNGGDGKDVPPVRGTYSSIAHFYRSLEDISSRIRDKNIENVLKERGRQTEGSSDHDGDMFTNIPGVSKTSKWQPRAAAAAGVGNERGQEILPLLRRKNSRRFQANLETDSKNENDGATVLNGDGNRNGMFIGLVDIIKSFVQAIPLKKKILFGSIIFVFILVTFIWFILGCYGLYFLVRQNLLDVQQRSEPLLSYINARANTDVSPVPKEIILRIVQDANVHMDENKIVHAAAEAIQKSITSEEL